MKVSIITPTYRRPEMLRNAISQYNAQDWKDKELILVVDAADFWTVEWLKANHQQQDDIYIYTVAGVSPIGMKRNNGIMVSSGAVIVHMDDDDVYAPDWVTKSVAALRSCKGNVTGLDKAFFKQGDNWYLWQYPNNAQPYVCEATMCYYREHAVLNPFPPLQMEEGKYFCAKSIVRPHSYIEGFTAIIHGANTCSHKSLPFMQKVTPAQQEIS